MIPDIRQEIWLSERVSRLLSAVFTDATDPELRKARFRRAIKAGEIGHALAGKNAVGKAENIEQLFERVYGESL